MNYLKFVFEIQFTKRECGSARNYFGVLLWYIRYLSNINMYSSDLRLFTIMPEGFYNVSVLRETY